MKKYVWSILLWVYPNAKDVIFGMKIDNLDFTKFALQMIDMAAMALDFVLNSSENAC